MELTGSSFVVVLMLGSSIKLFRLKVSKNKLNFFKHFMKSNDIKFATRLIFFSCRKSAWLFCESKTKFWNLHPNSINFIFDSPKRFCIKNRNVFEINFYDFWIWTKKKNRLTTQFGSMQETSFPQPLKIIAHLCRFERLSKSCSTT